MELCLVGESVARAETPLAPGSALPGAAPWDVFLQGLSEILEAINTSVRYRHFPLHTA